MTSKTKLFLQWFGSLLPNCGELDTALELLLPSYSWKNHSAGAHTIICSSWKRKEKSQIGPLQLVYLKQQCCVRESCGRCKNSYSYIRCKCEGRTPSQVLLQNHLFLLYHLSIFHSKMKPCTWKRGQHLVLIGGRESAVATHSLFLVRGQLGFEWMAVIVYSNLLAN